MRGWFVVADDNDSYFRHDDNAKDNEVSLKIYYTDDNVSTCTHTHSTYLNTLKYTRGDNEG